MRNLTGHNNTATGSYTLSYNKGGVQNTATGAYALNSITGNYNTATGAYALFSNRSGNNNTGIGYNAQVPDKNASNQVRIGNTDVTYAGVQVAWTVTSDKVWKEQIRILPYGLDMVMQLQPVDYVRKNNDSKTREMGFIAQDIEDLLTKVVYKDQGLLTKDDNGHLSLRYNDFIALLTKAVQEQQEIISSLIIELKTQKEETTQQHQNLEKLLERIENLEQISNQ